MNINMQNISNLTDISEKADTSKAHSKGIATHSKIMQSIANTLAVRVEQVSATVALLDEGATVPFIARYRKEATGGLDDTQLRNLQDQLIYLRELEDRKQVVLNSITEQGKLTPELEKAIIETDNKTILEDLYRPYKPKRRTKAQIAKEAGLEPLALALLENPQESPELLAATFLNPDHQIVDTKTALEGAKQILMELFAENAELLGKLREYIWEHAILQSKMIPDKETEGAKFKDYFDFSEPVKSIPSHRLLAVLRGRRESILMISLQLEESDKSSASICETQIAQHFNIQNKGRPADIWLLDCVRMAWKAKIFPHMELELINTARENAEEAAIHVFAKNLHDLLLASPAGLRTTLGLDPGLRTGVKVVVVDQTGKLLEHATIYPHVPHNQWDKSIEVLATLCKKYAVELISIGNGTASRETDRLCVDLLKKYSDLTPTKLVVSEAGASVYSASELAAKEFPDLDVSLRGAVSIARRLQDPLAELVKIDPKSIGVGQYQHDVNQSRLARSLENVVEDCVNAVGVDLNSASVPLLANISGLNETIAKNIVSFRDQNGAFKNRAQLKLVPRLGEKTYEQAAGFLRINGGDNPLDRSSVHPEAYPVVEKILAKSGEPITSIIGNKDFLKKLRASDYTDEKFGLPTVVDIITELEKPGRDPRPEFKTAKFQEGVETIKDLKSGMILEGVITNVTDFGAFVDIGVHQDGLVHISEMANKFIRNAREVVKAGDIVRVRVMEIDAARKRISLSMRLEITSTEKTVRPAENKKPVVKQEKKPATKAVPAPPSVLGAALAQAFKKSKE